MSASKKKTRKQSKRSPHPKTKAALATESHEKEFSGDDLIAWMDNFDKQAEQRSKPREQVLQELRENPDTNGTHLRPLIVVFCEWNFSQYNKH